MRLQTVKINLLSDVLAVSDGDEGLRILSLVLDQRQFLYPPCTHLHLARKLETTNVPGVWVPGADLRRSPLSKRAAQPP
jgi:hypothetical protein